MDHEFIGKIFASFWYNQYLNIMRGKVRFVKRYKFTKENSSYHWSSNEHAIRCTKTFAKLYNGDCVLIDEDDIRDYYDCCHLTPNKIEELSYDMRNVHISYYEDYDGEYYLDGNLADYI